MKFEIDPNELTTDQRAHVAAFITNWPMIKLAKNRFDTDQLIPHVPVIQTSVPTDIPPIPTEEQRLDAEQKEDLSAADECRKIGSQIAADNLNAIFGTPDMAKEIKQGIVDRAEVAANLNSLVPLDSQGLPWDSRIHASTKTFIADGSWKLRRGVDPTEVEKIKTQLKELMAVPSYVSVDNYTSNEVVQALGGSPVPTIPDQVHNTGHIDIDPSSRIPAPIPGLAEIVPPISGNVGIPTPPAPKSHYLIDQQPATFTLTDLIGRMSAAIAAGKLTQASIAEICTKHGVSEFHLLSNRPDLLPLIDADMKAMGV